MLKTFGSRTSSRGFESYLNQGQKRTSLVSFGSLDESQFFHGSLLNENKWVRILPIPVEEKNVVLGLPSLVNIVPTPNLDSILKTFRVNLCYIHLQAFWLAALILSQSEWSKCANREKCWKCLHRIGPMSCCWYFSVRMPRKLSLKLP